MISTDRETFSLYISVFLQKKIKCQENEKTGCRLWENILNGLCNNVLLSKIYRESKRNELSTTKRLERNLNTYFYVKRGNLKRPHHSLIPTIWHSEKDKTTEIKKINGCQGLWEWEVEYAEHGQILGQWNYFERYCNGGYTSLYICQNIHTSLNLNVSYRLWLPCHEYHVAVGCGRRRVHVCTREGGMWEHSVLPT